MDQERADYADCDPRGPTLLELVLEWAGPVIVVVIGAAAVWLKYRLDTHQ